MSTIWAGSPNYLQDSPIYNAPILYNANIPYNAPSDNLASIYAPNSTQWNNSYVAILDEVGFYILDESGNIILSEQVAAIGYELPQDTLWQENSTYLEGSILYNAAIPYNDDIPYNAPSENLVSVGTPNDTIWEEEQE